MKKIILLLAFLLSQFLSFSQSDVEINAIVLEYPKRFSNPIQLANRIKMDFITEESRAKAIYSWMAFNIRYDVKKYRNRSKPKIIRYKTESERQEKEKKQFVQQVNKTIRSRKGICGDYSALYYQLAVLVDLKCEMNSGTARTEKYDIGKKRVIIDHGWNSVQINGEWKLLDVTWGAGYLDEETDEFVPNYDLFYFDTPKELFFANHYPEKGVWHDVTVDKNAFLNAPFFHTELFYTNFEIIQPQNGVISIPQNRFFEFKIKNLTAENEIKYSLRKEGEFETVNCIDFKDDTGIFQIMIDRRIGKFLTLYIDGVRSATFRVIQK